MVSIPCLPWKVRTDSERVEGGSAPQGPSQADPTAPAPGGLDLPEFDLPGDVLPDQQLPDAEVITGWGLMLEAYVRLASEIRRDLSEHSGLDPAEFEVLLRLSRSPEQRQTASQLAAEVSFSSGGFTKLADRLERAGHVERRPSRQDRRVVWIALTPAGLQAVQTAGAHHVAFLRRRVLEPLGVDRFLAMGDIMRVLRDRAGQGRP